MHSPFFTMHNRDYLMNTIACVKEGILNQAFSSNVFLLSKEVTLR